MLSLKGLSQLTGSLNIFFFSPPCAWHSLQTATSSKFFSCRPVFLLDCHCLLLIELFEQKVERGQLVTFLKYVATYYRDVKDESIVG